MKRIQLLFFLISFPYILFSQEIKFKGTVLEKTKDPIENAKVTIEGTPFSEKTDEDGDFMFEEKIPLGKQIVSITKVGYTTKFFVIQVENGKGIIVDKIVLKLTKNEKRRRWVLKKVEQEEERRIQRERKKVSGILGKKTEAKVKAPKKVKAIKIKEPKVKEIDVVDPVVALIEKYAKVLEVPVSSISNIQLYRFIDNRKGSSSSSFFVKQLFENVYNLQIEGSVQEQYNSEKTDTFKNTIYLAEGDLVFFRNNGNKKNSASHVGVYLSNNKFVHSSNTNGSSGIKISDLRDDYWKARYICGGRR